MPRPIETRYGGRLFRSRAEARWAVFFDALGLRWEYEKEGFKLGPRADIFYLPDFWLPELAAWVEVKGTTPTDFELDKAALLCQETGFPVYIFFDGLEPRRYGESAWAELPTRSTEGVVAQWDDRHRWVECAKCGAVAIAATAGKGKCNCGYELDPHTPRLLRAYTAGTEARFEFGQHPAPPRERVPRRARRKA